MIYTVTFNPSLDYVIQTEELVPGRNWQARWTMPLSWASL